MFRGGFGAEGNFTLRPISNTPNLPAKNKNNSSDLSNRPQ
jgi:hypothetical protein